MFLLGYGERIVDLHAEVLDGALHLGVAKGLQTCSGSRMAQIMRAVRCRAVDRQLAKTDLDVVSEHVVQA